MARLQKDKEPEADYHSGQGQRVENKHTHLYVAALE